MKVGFLGNANNYPFALARAMRAVGVEVSFIVTSPAALDRPEHRFPDERANYSDWITDLAPMRTWDAVLPTAKHRQALRLLRSCDAVVMNGFGIALSTLLDRPSFAISSGSDLDVMADRNYLRQIIKEGGRSPSGIVRGLVKSALYRRLIPMQREGFRRAVGVEYTLPGVLPHGDRMLREIGVPDSRRFSFMLTDLEAIRPQPLSTRDRLTLLSIARLNWVEPLPPGFTVLDNKRTDILLSGIALYRARGGRPLNVVLVRKGLHIRETVALSDALGLSDWITWKEEMNQAQFIKEMAAADIIADQFGNGSIGMGVRDAIALGRPVIANGKGDIYARYFGTPLPVVEAAAAEEVAFALEVLADRSRRHEVAKVGRAFAEQHFSATAAARTIISLFENPKA